MTNSIVVNDFTLQYHDNGYIAQVNLGDIDITDLITKYTFDTNIFYRSYYQYSFHFSFTDRYYDIIYALLRTCVECEKLDDDKKVLSATLATHIFERMNVYAESLLNKRLYIDVIVFWRGVINAITYWQKMNGNANIHKGVAYGNLAKVYMIAGDIESSFLLLHNSINEDEKLNNFTQFKDYPQNAPSYLTLSLSPSKFNFLFGYLNDIRGYIENQIALYNDEFTQKFTIDEFDNLFLNNLKLDSIKEFRNMKFLFVFYLWSVVEQSKKYDTVNVEGGFSNVHKLNKISGASVLIDEILKFALNIDSGYIGSNIIKLNKSEHWVTDGFLDKYIIASYYKDKGKTTADKVNYIVDLLDKSKTKFEGDDLDCYKRMFTIIYLMRNLVSHSLYSESKFNTQFYDIMANLLNALFCIVRSSEWNKRINDATVKYP